MMPKQMRFRAVTAAIVAVLVTSGPAAADVNAGAALVQSHGCQGCHGAKYQGTSGFPALYGIEHRRSRDQIVAAILQPKAPMPNFGFTAAQAGDIADYLSSLDGGAAGAAPTIQISPAHPSDTATVTVHFPGTPPKSVTAVASMAMGGNTMNTPKVVLKRSPDGHTYVGTLSFSMGGAWTLHVVYDGKDVDQPLEVGQ